MCRSMVSYVSLIHRYQPTSALLVDIGEPEPTAALALLPGEEPIQYQVRTEAPLSDYTLLGNSSGASLWHSELGSSGELSISPSNVFYLAKAAPSTIAGAPSSAVLARRFTRGLVLFRTDLFGHSPEFMATSSETMALNGTYRRVSRVAVAGAAELGDLITEISLAGYEGAVLVREEAPPPPEAVDCSLLRSVWSSSACCEALPELQLSAILQMQLPSGTQSQLATCMDAKVVYQHIECCAV